MALAFVQCHTLRQGMLDNRGQSESKEVVPSSVYYVADQKSLQEIPDSPEHHEHQGHHGRDSHGATGKYPAVEEQDAEFCRQDAGAEEHIKG